MSAFVTCLFSCTATLLAAVISLGSAQSPMLPAGQPLSYSAVTTTQDADPHAYGVRLDLYKQGGNWSGFIVVYAGPVADPPAGKLDDLRLDESAGTLAFTAKLSLGITRGTSDWVPTRDLYQFTGEIDADTIVGTLVTGQVDSKAESREYVVLRRQPRETAAAASRDAWLRGWNEVLQVRGPKW
jgi:hypothetical protein